MMEYFPPEMFACYLNRDNETIVRGMSNRVYRLGLFLMCGDEQLILQDAMISTKIEEIT